MSHVLPSLGMSYDMTPRTCDLTTRLEQTRISGGPRLGAFPLLSIIK